MLKLTRGWEVARDHALMAVSTDNQMRIWYANDKAMPEAQGLGLLFKCGLGSVDLDNPIGELHLLLSVTSLYKAPDLRLKLTNLVGL